MQGWPSAPITHDSGSTERNAYEENSVFTLMVLIHVAISLVFNWIFGDSEPLGKTILTSAIFVAIFTAIIYNGEKGKSGE